jgi:hypothetical protein
MKEFGDEFKFIIDDSKIFLVNYGLKIMLNEKKYLIPKNSCVDNNEYYDVESVINCIILYSNI